MSHKNDVVDCPGCNAVFDKYPDFDQEMRAWFFAERAIDPTFHCSCAGRGQVDQEACFARGASKAHWKQSSHNVNGALDGFFQRDGKYDVDKALFVPIAARLPARYKWYGAPGAEFPETPHFEIADWRVLAASGQLKFVE
jgi:hypothetical protein